MKIAYTTLFFIFSYAGASAQSHSIEQVLQSIELHNKEILSNKEQFTAQRLEASSDNNLEDPTFSYTYMWGKNDGSISELELVQSFDFPTLYTGRHKLNKQRNRLWESQERLLRRDILLEAQELCLDIIMLRQQQAILNERLNQARALSELYAQRLEKGEAGILETNKLNLELLNVKTEAGLNKTALTNKLLELRMLNGDEPIVFEEDSYQPVHIPTHFAELKASILPADQSLLVMQQESELARRQIGMNRSQWLPKFELGYRRNTETGEAFNGLVVGVSIPLFENRNKVKVAKAQANSLNYQKEHSALLLENELKGLHQEALTLRAAMAEYEQCFATQSDMPLLKQALLGGEISIIEYYVEAASVYQSQLNYLQLQNQYQKTVARIYKNQL